MLVCVCPNVVCTNTFTHRIRQVLVLVCHIAAPFHILPVFDFNTKSTKMTTQHVCGLWHRSMFVGARYYYFQYCLNSYLCCYWFQNRCRRNWEDINHHVQTCVLSKISCKEQWLWHKSATQHILHNQPQRSSQVFIHENMGSLVCGFVT
jgi:hypothetical protein